MSTSLPEVMKMDWHELLGWVDELLAMGEVRMVDG
jgi:hypothetical protein